MSEKYRYERSRKDAVGLLTHYFRTAFEGAGLAFQEDCFAEMEHLADSLIDAAVAKMKQEAPHA